MSQYVTDASLWVAHFVIQDMFHLAVKTWLNRLMQGDFELLAPALLLTEVAGAIARRTGRSDLGQRAAAHLEYLPGLRLIALDTALVMAATDLTARLRLRGADAYYVAVASSLNLPLVTVDDEQAQRGTALVAIIRPGG